MYLLFLVVYIFENFSSWSLVFSWKIWFKKWMIMIFLLKILCTGVHCKSWFSTVEGSLKWALNTLDLGKKITLENHIQKFVE